MTTLVLLGCGGSAPDAWSDDADPHVDGGSVGAPGASVDAGLGEAPDANVAHTGVDASADASADDCPEIAACASLCDVLLNVVCGDSEMGTFACAEARGFIFSDGAEFACPQGDQPDDDAGTCQRASYGASQHCYALSMSATP